VIERRELFGILAAGAALPVGLQGAVYEPRFFTPAEYEAIDQICEAIIPKDEEGGGAHDAGVAAYVDTVILYADEKSKQFAREGLARLTAAPLDQLIEFEDDPFFSRLKALTIEGYFNSKVGFEYVGYKGNSGRLTFPGCNHPEHKP